MHEKQAAQLLYSAGARCRERGLGPQASFQVLLQLKKMASNESGSDGTGGTGACDTAPSLPRNEDSAFIADRSSGRRNKDYTLTKQLLQARLNMRKMGAPGPTASSGGLVNAKGMASQVRTPEEENPWLGNVAINSHPETEGIQGIWNGIKGFIQAHPVAASAIFMGLMGGGIGAAFKHPFLGAGLGALAGAGLGYGGKSWIQSQFQPTPTEWGGAKPKPGDASVKALDVVTK